MTLPSCSDPQAVTVEDDATTSVRLDTTGGAPSTLPLGTCAGGASPQAVVVFTVPGTGPRAITVSTVNAGTDTRFDTLLAVRRAPCVPVSSTLEPDHCYDDETSGRELRSRGTFLAEGGEVIFVVVTGYQTPAVDRMNEGLVQLDITVNGARAPTLTSASVLVTPESARVAVDAGDLDGDADRVLVTFHGPAGELLDVDDDGRATGADALEGDFDRPVAGALSFSESASIPLSAAQHAALSVATTAHVVIVDRGGTPSEASVSAPVLLGTVVGPGGACGPTNVCAGELACAADMTCQPAADRIAACAAALALDVPMSTGVASTGRGTAVISTGAGLFTAQCLAGSTGGREEIFRITVPTGAWDLLLTTDSPGTAGTDPLEPDTVIYARRGCTDASLASAPMEWCSDDIESGVNQRSAFEIRDVAPGDLFAFVELYGGSAPIEGGARVELAATLRPVLPTGATCDPTGEDNRCAMGDCPVALGTCP